MLNFVTLYPEARNIHLIKDVGMIPYILHATHNYNSKLVCYKNDSDYSYIDQKLNGLKIEFMKKISGDSKIDGALYLFRKSRSIDVLNLYHLSPRNFIWIVIYKILNPKGKIFLKLDADNKLRKSKILNKSLKSKIKWNILRMCHLITIETTELKEFACMKLPLQIEYLPNGFFDFNKRPIIDYSKKENIILTVGRIGTYQKATEVLMRAIALKQDELNNWEIRIIGPIEESFHDYINSYFIKYPELIDRVTFVGPIYDRYELEKEYLRSKIFCLSSRAESFGLVLLEAMQYGCYIITTNVESAYDLTDNGKYGSIVPIDDTESLAASIIETCKNNYSLEELCNSAQNFVYTQFYWPTICKKIDSLLNSK